MKKFNSKKSIILPVIAAASLSVSTFALASGNNIFGSNPSNNSGFKDIGNAIKDLGDKMVALGFAGMTAYDQAMYQYDQNLLDTLNANSAGTAVNKASASTAAKTKNYIKDSFQNIPDAVLSTGEEAINAHQIRNNIKNQNSLINKLTLGVPASDTIYINDPTTLAAAYGNTSFNIQKYYKSNTKYTIGPPPMNDDVYFNISSLLQPSAFTEKQKTAANAYMTYLTQSYKNPATNLKLSELKSYLNGLKQDKRPQALYNFISSSEYQKYQLALRSIMASKSIAINNFEHIISQRTPSKKAVAGITTPDGSKTIKHPSPLQVRQYQALHRIDNPAWIESLQNQSSTTLQREIAVELAQIIKQNYQAHQDRERMITTLSALQLAGSQAGEMKLQMMAQKLNQQIDSLAKSGNDNTNTSVQNTKAQKEATEKAKEAAKKEKEKDQRKKENS